MPYDKKNHEKWKIIRALQYAIDDCTRYSVLHVEIESIINHLETDGFKIVEVGKPKD